MTLCDASTDAEMPGTNKSNPLDLLVIGGGINGVGVARDAVGRGLSVLLCEKGDLAEGTSSRSGKYIHGGLRYLEYYEFRLVREALIEREVVLEVAPHLAWPLRLVLPHSPEQRPRWLIRLGLFLYDHLGGRKRIPGTRAVNLRKEPEGNALRDQFPRGFAYWDVWIDDARLVVLNALDAARRGARILTRTSCVSARREGALWRCELKDTLTGEVTALYSKAIFNGAGPWVENVIGSVAGVNAKLNVRLVKGSHIIMKRWWWGDHGYVLQAKDKRLIFVNPYFDDLALIGTTDIPFDGKAEDVTIESSEVTYLLDVLNRYFAAELTPENVLHSYSGVRPLFDDDADKSASAVTRDYQFELDGSVTPGDEHPPILSAFGGKLTTYRKLSEHALERLKPYFPAMGGSWTSREALPGGDIADADFDKWQQGFQTRFPWLSSDLVKHYGRCYGTMSDELLNGAQSIADLGLHFGALFYEREARWLIDFEWARTADDILLRRTKHGLFMSKDEQAKFEGWLLHKKGAA